MDLFDVSASLTLNSDGFDTEVKNAADAGRDAAGALGGLEGAAKKAGDGFTVLKGIAADLISSGIQKIAGAVTSSFDAAIARVDTLNNYSTTMQTLGYSANDADAAIDKLTEGIQGLPTNLQDIASVQQQFTALTGDISGATDLTIALNNATLAAGQGQEQASRAMDAWYKIMAKGTPDAEQWLTLTETMPGQLDMIAKSMLGASASSADLQEAWKSGQVSAEDVQKALLDLNENGGAGMASFEEQAFAATGGIETSMARIQSAVTRAEANIIRAFDGSTVIAEGAQEIIDVIDGISNHIQTFISNVQGLGLATALDNEIRTLLASAGNAISQLPAVLADSLPEMSSILESVFGGISTAGQFFVDKLIQGVSDSIPQLYDFILETLNNVLSTALTLIGSAVDSIAQNLPTMISEMAQVWSSRITELAQIFATMLPQLAQKIVEAVPSLISALVGLFPVMLDTIKQNLPTIVDAGLDILSSLVQGIIGGIGALVEALPSIVSAIWDFITGVNWLSLGVKIIKGIVSGIISLAGALIGAAAKIPGWIIKGVGAIAKTGIEIIKNLWNGIAQRFSTLFSDIVKKAKEIPKKIKSGVGNLLGVGKDIIEGLWKGIREKFDGVIKGVKEKAKNVKESITGFFKIGSPSKVMRDIGRWIGIGLELGIEDSWRGVEQASAELAEKAMTPLDEMAFDSLGGVEVEGEISGRAMGGISNIFNINVDGADNPEDWANRLIREMNLEMRIA